MKDPTVARHYQEHIMRGNLPHSPARVLGKALERKVESLRVAIALL
jgi:hypothetical protein